MKMRVGLLGVIKNRLPKRTILEKNSTIPKWFFLV